MGVGWSPGYGVAGEEDDAEVLRLREQSALYEELAALRVERARLLHRTAHAHDADLDPQDRLAAAQARAESGGEVERHGTATRLRESSRVYMAHAGSWAPLRLKTA